MKPTVEPDIHTENDPVTPVTPVTVCVCVCHYSIPDLSLAVKTFIIQEIINSVDVVDAVKETATFPDAESTLNLLRQRCDKIKTAAGNYMDLI